MKTLLLGTVVLTCSSCASPNAPTPAPTCSTIAEYRHQTICRFGVCTLTDVGEPTYVTVCSDGSQK